MKDPVIPTVINWVKQPKEDKRTLVECLAGVASEYEKCYYAAHQKEFTIQDNLLYLQATPTNSQDSVPVFMVPEKDRRAAIDGCHCSTRHQGRDRTLSLMKEHFWWPRMSQALLKSVANCGKCFQYEAKGQLPPMQPIMCTEPLELVHIDYVGMEVTVATDKKPVCKEHACCRRPFHPVCAGIHHKEPYGKNDSPSAVQQLLLRFWVPTMLNVGPRNRILRESDSSDV